MEIVVLLGFAGLSAVVLKFVDFMRLLGSFPTEKSAIATQLLAWVGGIVAVLIYASSDFASSVEVGDQLLSELNMASKVLVGLMTASVASAAVDVKQALDGRDTSTFPPLL